MYIYICMRAGRFGSGRFGSGRFGSLVSAHSFQLGSFRLTRFGSFVSARVVSAQVVLAQNCRCWHGYSCAWRARERLKRPESGALPKINNTLAGQSKRSFSGPLFGRLFGRADTFGPGRSNARGAAPHQGQYVWHGLLEHLVRSPTSALVCLPWAALWLRSPYGRVLITFGMGRPMAALSLWACA